MTLIFHQQLPHMICTQKVHMVLFASFVHQYFSILVLRLNRYLGSSSKVFALGFVYPLLFCTWNYLLILQMFSNSNQSSQFLQVNSSHLRTLFLIKMSFNLILTIIILVFKSFQLQSKYGKELSHSNAIRVNIRCIFLKLCVNFCSPLGGKHCLANQHSLVWWNLWASNFAISNRVITILQQLILNTT